MSPHRPGFGYDCSACPESTARVRGCSKRAMPRPLISAYEQTHGEVCVERWDCPVNLVTVEQMQVLRDFGHYRAGRPLYPVISDYPNRLLRQLEVVESEVAANTLALKEGA